MAFSSFSFFCSRNFIFGRLHFDNKRNFLLSVIDAKKNNKQKLCVILPPLNATQNRSVIGNKKNYLQT
jgi:hypothetical protein